MDSIIISLVGGFFLMLVTTIILAIARPQRRARALNIAFFIVLAAVVSLELMLPADLYIIPERFVSPSRIVGTAFTICLMAAGFFGGIMQLYNLADRGFSLRIMIDVLEAPECCMTLDQVMHGYSAGRGISWMYDKRIDGMVGAGLIRIDSDAIALTERGARVARLFWALQRIANVA